MWWGKEERQVYACLEPVDMRCSFDGLIAATRSRMKSDPLSGAIYLFTNRRTTIAKLLWWDRTGWCVLAKRLERGHFSPRREEFNLQELQLVLDGIALGSKRMTNNRECTMHGA
jgi:transposase